MNKDDASGADGPVLLIVGGGFSGTMVAAQLAAEGVSSRIIDAGEAAALGAAYATRDPEHLLNVRASSMSALAGAPGDFAAFAAPLGVAPSGFARRRDYGRYLAAQHDAAVASGRVARLGGRAVAARPRDHGWDVTLADGRLLRGDGLLLATGNPPPAPLPGMAGVAGHDRIDRPWLPQANARLAAAAAAGEPVLIVGTGLTMVDAVLSLDAAGHRGPITAVSRRGLVPHGHADGLSSALPPVAADALPGTVRGMVRWLRKRAAAEADWRLAIDALRPVTHGLWRSLGADDQRRFLRHARAWWDIHRHRLAPSVVARIDALRSEGRLTVIAGRLRASDAIDGGYRFAIDRRGGGVATVEAGLLVNATGPAASLNRSGDPLLAQLRDEGLVRADAIDLGIALDAEDRIMGPDGAFATAWAMGPVARAHYWEMTAVPDLSSKAADLAGRIAAALRVPAEA